jgi:hypothetical protein
MSFKFFAPAEPYRPESREPEISALDLKDSTRYMSPDC